LADCATKEYFELMPLFLILLRKIKKRGINLLFYGTFLKTPAICFARAALFPERHTAGYRPAVCPKIPSPLRFGEAKPQRGRDF
jgi:hypothetical protein